MFALRAQKQGHFHQIGERQAGDPILIAEGYATAVSIHEATGRSVVMACDSGNLKPVAETLRAKAPEAAILICGDNDHHLGMGDENVGVLKAHEAADAVGGKAVTPGFTTEERASGKALTDFNDLHRSRGLEVVKRHVEAPLERMIDVKDKERGEPEQEKEWQRQEKGAELGR